MTPAEQTDELLAALQGAPGALVLTAPNSDAQNRDIRERLERFVADRPHASLHSSLGQRLYYSLLRHADLMVGNSSSGIWEAPSFGLPVVNIGERQRGRRRAANVIDVPCQAAAIRAAVDRALDLGFRSGLRGLVNPYGDGHAAQRVVGVLERVPLGAQLLRKTFAHLPQPGLTNGSLP
jgi:UDP-hydrolysing UDP-N-acetyl-D-glucosamine 2-epimerase